MWFAYVLGLAALVGTGAMIYAMRKGGNRRDALQDYAEAQGWQIEYVAATQGTPGMMAMSDPEGDWVLRGMMDRHGRRFEWSCPDGALSEGTAVLGPPLPPNAIQMMRGGGETGNAVLKAGVQQTIAALGRTARDLEVDEANADHPGGVVMASPGQAQVMDDLREAAEVKMARVGKSEADQPVIVRDTEGLKLHRVGALQSFDELRDMVALGTALRAYLPVEPVGWH